MTFREIKQLNSNRTPLFETPVSIKFLRAEQRVFAAPVCVVCTHHRPLAPPVG